MCFLRQCLQIFLLVIVLKALSSGSNVKHGMSCTNNAKELSLYRSQSVSVVYASKVWHSNGLTIDLSMFFFFFFLDID